MQRLGSLVIGGNMARKTLVSDVLSSSEAGTHLLPCVLQRWPQVSRPPARLPPLLPSLSPKPAPAGHTLPPSEGPLTSFVG